MSNPGESKGPIAWMAHNTVAANLLMAILIIGGFLTYFTVTKEVFPDIQYDIISVDIAYPGASPSEVEQGVVLAVEDAIGNLAGVEEITSIAGEGFASIRAELIDGVDAGQVYQDIQSEVDRITTLPEDAEEPQVSMNVRRRDVIELAVYGQTSEKVLKRLAERVRDQLLQSSEISQIELYGTRDPEITVEISNERLREYGLTLDDIAAVLRAESVEIPGGGIKTESGEILIRMTERRNVGEEFGLLPIITSRGGAQVLLGDIAHIRDGLEERERFATFNGMPAVMLEVFRVGRQTPVKVAESVMDMLDEIRLGLPEGVDVAVRRSMADIYSQRANLLLRNGVIGLVLVLLLLSLFLEFRLAFWVMMGIPISFMGSLLFMPVLDLSINMITMFAYIVALGIVVDDAIVVGENVYSHHQDGKPFILAAIDGAREVAMPVGFSILTNMIAFLPLYFMPGVMGRIMGMLPLVVISVFLISWVESLLVLPAHLGHHGSYRVKGWRRWLHTRQQQFSAGFMEWVRKRYIPFLSRALQHRYFVVSVALGLLILTVGYMVSGRMGFEMFPRVESDYAYASASLPYGVPVEQTEALANRMAVAANAVAEEAGHPELIKGVFAQIGENGSHDVNVRAYLAEPSVRKKIMSTSEFTRRWRAQLGAVKGLEFIKFQSDRGGPGSGDALTVELAHSEVKTLELAATDLASALEDFPGVSDIDDGFQFGKEQLSFRMKPEGLSLGLTAREVARQVRSAYEGIEVLRQQRGRNELTVRIQLPEDERVSENSLSSFILITPGRGEVALHDVVTVEHGRAYTSISHRGGRRTMTVTADVRPRSEAGRVIENLNAEVLPVLQSRYPGLTFSYQGRQADMRESFQSLFITIPMVLIGIYGLLAVPFRSYIQPLIVMMSIPFGVVGAVAGHLIMGYSLSMMGLIGIVALSGVVVNDSLVFVDFANRRRREGLTVHEALLSAGTSRFRPILLTTLTTFGGLAPMIFETSRQARFLIPMAISLGYGLLFATAITLLLVPSLYAIVDDCLASKREHNAG